MKKVWVRESKGAVPFLSLTFGGMDDGLAVREGVIGVVGCIFFAGSWVNLCAGWWLWVCCGLGVSECGGEPLFLELAQLENKF